jgi:hypothetical protein
VQRRRLQTLAREFEKGGASFDPGVVPKAGTRLVRQWRGHAYYTVLVREDGFEYEGHHYRSLTVIAERITGAHWLTASSPGLGADPKHGRVWSGQRTVDPTLWHPHPRAEPAHRHAV